MKAEQGLKQHMDDARIDGFGTEMLVQMEWQSVSLRKR